jgi:hypothetical protein
MATAPAQAAPIFDLAELKKLYREARDATDQARKAAEECIDYYDNKQLSAKMREVLRKRRQPEIFVNRMAPAIDGILGVLEQGQSDPRAYPRNSEDQNASEVATDALRYSADRSRWSRTKLKAAKSYLLAGIGAVIVEVNESRDPYPRVIRYHEFIYDPFSEDEDFEDARYMGIAKWMYVDAVTSWIPGAQVDLDAASTGALALTDEDEDKPANVWCDRKRRRVLVVELYINQGGWKRVVFYGGGILSEEPSPYLDEGGEDCPPQPCNPIVAQSCKVKRKNERYGPAEAMVPLQDEINMRRSRALHMSNSRQVRITDQAGPETDIDTIRAEAARPDGVLPFGVEPSPMTDLAGQQFQLLTEGKSEIERLGPNPAVLGQSAASASGRSQLVRQQAGLTELTPSLGGIEDLELRVYRQMWARIKQFWTAQKTIRVTDDIGAAKFLMVNEPVVQEVPAIVMGPDGRPMVGTQQVVVEVKNRPAEMDMDIIVDAVADTANVQSEQFAELVKLAGIYGPQEVPFDDLLEASSLPKKRELIEKREARKQEAMQGQAPAQQMQQAAFEAEIGVKQAKTALDGAKADGQQLENHINALSAGMQFGMAGMPAA